MLITEDRATGHVIIVLPFAPFLLAYNLEGRHFILTFMNIFSGHCLFLPGGISIETCFSSHHEE